MNLDQVLIDLVKTTPSLLHLPEGHSVKMPIHEQFTALALQDHYRYGIGHAPAVLGEVIVQMTGGSLTIEKDF